MKAIREGRAASAAAGRPLELRDVVPAACSRLLPRTPQPPSITLPGLGGAASGALPMDATGAIDQNDPLTQLTHGPD
jgi:hypothetical protein